MPDLSGVVALVTGASKGVGRGCALGLAEYGATVHITGRSLESGSGAVSWRVARTALVSLALVLLFGTLLGSADAVYGS